MGDKDFDWTESVNTGSPLENLRLLRGSSMAIIGTTLYIDGGEYYTSGFNGTTESQDGPPDFDDKWAANQYIYSLDLTKPYRSRNFTEMSQQMKAIKKDAEGWSSTIGGYLQAVDGVLYHAGGIQTHYKLKDDETTNWSYDGKTFKPAALKGDVKALNLHNGASTSSPDGVIYYFAGQSENGTAVANLVAWDTKKGTVKLLSQENPFITGTGTGIIGGTLNWIPVGVKGSLVSFGGSLMKGETSSQGNPMTKAGVFDIANRTWYSQTLVSQADNNEFPRTRKFFPAVTPKPDKSQQNWEILIYGGLTGEAQPGKDTGERYDDIWCLTLPSFQWLKYYTQPGGDNFGKYNRSFTFTNDRFLTFLDQVRTNRRTNETNDDVFAFYDTVNAKGFDAGGFVEYDPTEKGYSPPLKVQVAISNPVKNDLASGLSGLFAKSYFDPDNPSALTPPADSSNSTTTKATSHTGAIAGGVAGGVAGLLLFAGLLFFLFRRRKGRQEGGNPHFDGAPTGGQEDSSDASKAELPAIPPPPTYGNGTYQVVPQTTHEVYGDAVANQRKPQGAAELDSETGPAELPAGDRG